MESLVPVAISIVFVINGIACGVVALVTYRKQSAKALSARATGEVVDVVEKASRHGTTAHPVVRFQDMYGREHVFESNFGYGYGISMPSRGDNVGVMYNPAEPEKAEAENPVGQWFIPALFAVGTVLSFVIAG